MSAATDNLRNELAHFAEGMMEAKVAPDAMALMLAVRCLEWLKGSALQDVLRREGAVAALRMAASQCAEQHASQGTAPDEMWYRRLADRIEAGEVTPWK